VRQAADLGDEKNESKQAEGKQPEGAVNRAEQAFDKNRAHPDPDYESQRQFHRARE